MTTEHDTDDLDFAMLTPPTRPGPCKVAAAPELDPVEARLELEVEAAPHVAAALNAREGLRRLYRMKMLSRPVGIETNVQRRGRETHEAIRLRGRPDAIVNGIPQDHKCIEVRHGSGKVKV